MRLSGPDKARLASAGVSILRVGLGCVFVSSSLGKVCQPYAFLANVYSYELLGPRLGIVVAMIVPWVELLVGLCLVGSIFVGGAALVSAGMSASFTFFLVFAVQRDLDIACGCFRGSRDPVGYGHVARAVVMLLASIVIYAHLAYRSAKKVSA